MSIGVKLKNFNNAEIIKIALLKIYLNLACVLNQSGFYVFSFDLKNVYLDGIKKCGVKECWCLGFVEKTKVILPFSLINLTMFMGQRKKKKKVHIYPSANNRILIPENGKQF